MACTTSLSVLANRAAVCTSSRETQGILERDISSLGKGRRFRSNKSFWIRLNLQREIYSLSLSGSRQEWVDCPQSKASPSFLCEPEFLFRLIQFCLGLRWLNLLSLCMFPSLFLDNFGELFLSNSFCFLPSSLLFSLKSLLLCQSSSFLCLSIQCIFSFQFDPSLTNLSCSNFSRSSRSLSSRSRLCSSCS